MEKIKFFTTFLPYIFSPELFIPKDICKKLKQLPSLKGRLLEDESTSKTIELLSSTFSTYPPDFRVSPSIFIRVIVVQRKLNEKLKHKTKIQKEHSERISGFAYYK